jgi:excisionase family DNA binding protein
MRESEKSTAPDGARGGHVFTATDRNGSSKPTTASASPFLSRPDAARYLGLAVKTLEKYVVTGGGPPYRKHGRRVLYRREDLDRWSDERLRLHSADPGPTAA